MAQDDRNEFDDPLDGDFGDGEVELLGSFGGFMFSADGPRRNVQEIYGVFRRPRNSLDRETDDLARKCGAFDGITDTWGELDLPEMPELRREEWELGEVLEEEGRLLLSGLGGECDKLFAAPTTTDAVAYALLPNGGVRCTHPGPDGLVLSHVTSPASATLVGLVADSIVAVDVVLAGQARRALMGENAFGLVVAESPLPEIDALVLHRRDESRNEIALGVGGSDEPEHDPA